MTACGLASPHDGQRWVPRLLGVRSDQWGGRVTVRLLPGQHPDDWAKAAPRLAYSLRLREARTFTSDRPDRVVLYFARRDPLAAVVGPLPAPAQLDLSGLEFGKQEAGTPYLLRLAGSHVLIAGATNSGKGSVIWSLLRSLATGISSGLVEVWAFDPKGGMELAAGTPLFARFAYDDPDTMAGVLEEAVKRMRQRADRLRGITRQHTPTVDDLAELAAGYAPGGRMTLGAVQPARIRAWRRKLLDGGTPEPQAVKAYALLRAIFNTAIREDEIIRQNPCRIPGYDRYHTPERPTATVAQVFALAHAVPGVGRDSGVVGAAPG
ncbi:FtsK/SpoIIIE domain-containing protein [Actinoplanes siamensis]|uniref:FtsK domain-containing protein n=1 Tax=Actinoplanes siamensis TaxID=1223317 RepID=A0A919NFB3_9ACTN|nr:FtsK/SpoIIIE domain-containing protein [Actinoplanes siamensis]GIF09813.1 hypothetical protein Asi03nite_73510 [Actinoplanes siamensis]